MKHCIVCNKEAAYRIKDTPEFYCRECAEENFAELSLLLKVEAEAQQLKKMVEHSCENSPGGTDTLPEDSPPED